MKKVLLFFALTFGILAGTNAQETVEELKAAKAEKAAQVAALQGEINGIQGKIDALPGWRKGIAGTIGFSLNVLKTGFKKQTLTLLLQRSVLQVLHLQT